MDANGQNPARTPSSMRFSEHQRAQEEDRVIKLMKQNGNTICNNIISILLLCVAINFTSVSNCGPDIVGLLKLAIWIKVGVAAYFIAVNALIKNSRIRVQTANFMIGGIWLIMLYWHWIVFRNFFSSQNDCRKKSTLIWISHVSLLADAIVNFGICCCISCGVCIFCVAFCVAKRRDVQREQANLKIKDLLLNAAQFKRNPSEYEVGDTCPICILEFAEDDNIICLPCNNGHVFHSDCIGEWVKRKNCCPICKAEITPDAIAGAAMEDFPIMAPDLEAQPQDQEIENSHGRRPS
ncbi:unnamed protein product [Moneuplotes crassus]|uniref:RING-type domain-containing protein n=1 Tax=Euplotes crassus TaxID=5936 RepID=A0AAD2D0U2_EUPCR|nr:unnamed protein product [Moneuplotes crassus]